MSRVSFLPLRRNDDCSFCFTPLVEPVFITLVPAFNRAPTVRLVACLAGRLLTSFRNTDATFFPVCRKKSPTLPRPRWRLGFRLVPPLPLCRLTPLERPLPFCRLGCRLDLAIPRSILTMV